MPVGQVTTGHAEAPSAANDGARFAAASVQAGKIAADHTAIEKFGLADGAFRTSGAPPGWTRLDDNQIRGMHLDPGQFHPADSGFRAVLFRAADGHTALSFKGTTVSSPEDWKNNLQQGFGLKSDYYSRAIALGQQVVRATGGQTEFVGQSLGGGLATAAGLVTHTKTTTFNAAGVAGATLAPYGVSTAEATKPMADGRPLIDSYDVKGEILDGAQRAAGPILNAISPLGNALLEATGHHPEPAAGVPHVLQDPHPIPLAERLIAGALGPLVSIPLQLAHAAGEHVRPTVRAALEAQLKRDEATP